jgi:hypothetical protein
MRVFLIIFSRKVAWPLIHSSKLSLEDDLFQAWFIALWFSKFMAIFWFLCSMYILIPYCGLPLGDSKGPWCPLPVTKGNWRYNISSGLECKNQVPVSKKVCLYRSSYAQSLHAKHRSKYCIPSSAIMTPLHVRKILNRDNKHLHKKYMPNPFPSNIQYNLVMANFKGPNKKLHSLIKEEISSL